MRCDKSPSHTHTHTRAHAHTPVCSGHVTHASEAAAAAMATAKVSGDVDLFSNLVTNAWEWNNGGEVVCVYVHTHLCM